MFKYTAMDSLNKGVEWCDAHLACPPPLPPPPPPSPRWYPPRSWEPPPYFFLFMAPSHAAAAAAASASAPPPQCQGRECAPPVVKTPGSRSSSSGLDLSGPRCRRCSGLPPRPLLFLALRGLAVLLDDVGEDAQGEDVDEVGLLGLPPLLPPGDRGGFAALLLSLSFYSPFPESFLPHLPVSRKSQQKGRERRQK